jgi:hypothetical protein
MLAELFRWVLHYTGSDNVSGPWYGFFSGFGSDLGEITLVGAVVAFYWKHTCHVGGCWRLGRLKVEGSEWTVCHKHHPEGPPSHHDILRHFHQRQEEKYKAQAHSNLTGRAEN